MTTGETFTSSHYGQEHTVARDVTLAVCGRPVPADAQPGDGRRRACPRCNGVDYSRPPNRIV